MKNIPNLVGKRFGTLTVLNKSDKRDNQLKILWSCRCDCGKELLIRTHPLQHSVKSCGCKTKESRRNPDTSFVQRMNYYKEDAKAKGRKFDLSLDQFKTLIQKNCYYCGCPPTLWSPYFDSQGQIRPLLQNKMDHAYLLSTQVLMNGLDRIDNAKGYSIQNVVPACRKCNLMKSVYSQVDFFEHIRKIIFFQNHYSTLVKST